MTLAWSVFGVQPDEIVDVNLIRSELACGICFQAKAARHAIGQEPKISIAQKPKSSTAQAQAYGQA